MDELVDLCWFFDFVLLTMFFGISVGRNICHGSDSVESAENEIALWFPEGVAAWESCQKAWVYE